MNTRYLAYCADQGGYSPDAMVVVDEARYPGGKMTGYMIWIDNRWREWIALSGAHPYCLTEQNHKDFDAWLNEKYDVRTEASG